MFISEFSVSHTLALKKKINRFKINCYVTEVQTFRLNSECLFKK